MSFEPVELVHRDTGRKYTAHTAVDLNDRVNEGFVRVEKPASVKPSPSPRVYDYDSADYSYDAVDYRDAE